jgi:tRNA(fMet)-specific endonuclease VapC
MGTPVWMLDTNILSELIRDPHGALAKRAVAEPDGSVCTSIIVACELRCGALREGSALLAERAELLLSRLSVLPFDGAADRHYAEIRTALERSGTLIGSHDLFIAAHARSRAVTLVTRTLREYRCVPDLKVTDWMGDPAARQP